MDELRLKNALRCQIGQGIKGCNPCPYRNTDSKCNIRKIAVDALVYISSVEQLANMLQDQLEEFTKSKREAKTMCTYYQEYGKIPCCTHDCAGCIFNPADEEIVEVEFSGEDLDMILKYQKLSEATSIQSAIMNAISLALDYTDDCK